ncbi:MAG: Uma2 family endonuclease [Pyrinomonadaceae bacterium]|nr:Uma2 family endonuclease [Pyrinomonadaceae bacterium]
MLAQTEIYLDAIEHLPSGATLRLRDVSWDEYEELLAQMENKPGYRVSYDRGRLEIMSPRADHEKPKEFILVLARVLAEETDTTLETLGSTTYRRRKKLKGAEPDTSFYVQNAARVIGRRVLDLEVDPPPDVVVEIDTTNESLSKFSIYAALGVPEIWLYDGNKMLFYQLTEQHYTEIPRSRAFPLLAAEAVTKFLERSQTEGQTAALRAFRQWAREQASNIKE